MKNDDTQTIADSEVHIKLNSFELEGTQYYIKFDPEYIQPPQIHSSLALFSSMDITPTMNIKPDYILESALDLLTNREGPDIGGVITWKTTDPTFKMIYWVSS